MKKIWFAICTLIFFIILCTGCKGKREINELAIATAIGIDKNDNQYRVTVQVLNPSEVATEKAGGGGSAVTTYSTNGYTLFEALRRVTMQSSRRIYVSHIQIVIFGQEIAEDGIGETLDFLSRDHEMRANMYMLVAKDKKAEDALKVLTPLEKIPASKIFSSLEKEENSWPASASVKLDELISTTVSEGKNPVLAGVVVKGKLEAGKDNKNIQRIEPEAVLDLDGIAVLKKDKLIGWLNEREGIAYNLAVNKVKNTVITLSCIDEGKLTIEMNKIKSKIKCSIKDGSPKGSIDIKVEGNVGEVECKIDLTKPESIEKIQNDLENEIKQRIEGVLEKTQKDLQCDIFGFGEALHRSNPKQWKTLKNNWDEKFADLPIDVKVHCEVKRLGTTINPVLKKEKE
ncbi:Ger(x)C family spore germination protein [Clostridium sp. SYSU_GA19001]|uniref:Ger(x)C family spore germination protein n=1 Tax=Clostridium caldaquaticum TaxID=2940653 RepID=UPI002076DF43|nr:Ger(x)C family spore germination protein [Clostridium caldaquaticum]MCM8709509.1 Ger(x)C family spore germination protein [Clostridium caldaquaticum]